MSIPDSERERINAVINYWFYPADFDRMKAGDIQLKKWFGFNKEVDDEITTLFKSDLDAIEAGKYTDWLEDRDGLLALSILCDQFARQIYRKQFKAFSFDKQILPKIDSLTSGNEFDYLISKYKPTELRFLMFPLMHSENVEHGEKLCAYCDYHIEIVQNLDKVMYGFSNEEYASRLKSFKKISNNHLDILKKYGRYPHRNLVLGRESTPEEIEYLKNAETYGQ